MNSTKIALKVYKQLVSSIIKNVIPINLRHKKIIGTTQDDPFDSWVQQELETNLGIEYEIYNTGKLQTPDLIIRHKATKEILCIEVKKLTQKKNGQDPRGWTIDYNSSLPCGKTIIQVGEESIIVPLYYLFALLNSNKKNIVTLIILDGDFLNYDFEIHKEAKTSNYMEYNHGPYEEGSVRHRKMYVYPNPLNAKLNFFHLKYTFVAKKHELDKLQDNFNITAEIIRRDKFNNSFHFLVKNDYSVLSEVTTPPPIIEGVFDSLKKRKSKKRSLTSPKIPK